MTLPEIDQHPADSGFYDGTSREKLGCTNHTPRHSPYRTDGGDTRQYCHPYCHPIEVVPSEADGSNSISPD